MTGRLWLKNRNPAQLVDNADIVNRSSAVYAVSRIEKNSIQITPETTAALLVGPGCTVSSLAMRHIISGGCSVLWLSKTGAKVAAITAAPSLSSGTELLNRQAQSTLNKMERRRTAFRSLALRFGGLPPETYNLEQLRGWEGIRVRKHYVAHSQSLGIEWRGRLYEGKTDYVNGMISSCNSAVYTACTAAVLALGLSPDLGFLHVGKNSFIYDIADHFKATSSVERVLNHFAQRDRSSEMDSSFQFAKAALTEIVTEVFAEVYNTIDKVLVKA